MQEIFQALADVERAQQAAALCTVIRSEGSTPRHVGSKMLVYADGHFLGTVGGGDLEHRVLAEAAAAISDGIARRLSYTMADPARGDPGVCGGQVEVFVDPILPAPLILVVGAGHVGRAVVYLAKWLGFRVAVSDDRAEYCNPQAVPGADAYYVVPMEKLAEQVALDSRTYLILTTRGSAVDVAGLRPLLDSQAAYIGVIGSRRRWATTVRELRAHGIAQDKIERVHSPMGLELQAETPQEIAVSILAEVLMLRAQASGAPMRSEAASSDAA